MAKQCFKSIICPGAVAIYYFVYNINKETKIACGRKMHCSMPFLFLLLQELLDRQRNDLLHPIGLRTITTKSLIRWRPQKIQEERANNAPCRSKRFFVPQPGCFLKRSKVRGQTVDRLESSRLSRPRGHQRNIQAQQEAYSPPIINHGSPR